MISSAHLLQINDQIQKHIRLSESLYKGSYDSMFIKNMLEYILVGFYYFKCIFRVNSHKAAN